MWPFAARPRAKKLYRITRRLGPATMGLQRLVEFVTEVARLLFCHQTCALLWRGRGGGLAHGAIPFGPPLPEAFLTDGVNVHRATSAMQAKSTATKGDAQRLLGAEAVRRRKFLEHLLQCAGERCGGQAVLGRRGHAIGLATRDRLQCGVTPRLL